MHAKFTIRFKTFAVIGVTFAVLVASLYWLTSYFLQTGFGEVEAQETRRNVDRVQAALDDSVVRLNSVAGDWGGWDEAYTFMQGRNPNYIVDSLNPESIAGISVNLLAFLRTDGTVVYGTGFDSRRGVNLPVPKVFLTHLRAGSPLTQHKSITSSKSGLLVLPDGVWMVASRPVLTSEKLGPIRGTIVMARHLDKAEIQRLEKLTNLTFFVRSATSTDIPLPGEQAKVEPLGDGTVAGETRLADIYGQPALALQVVTPRTIWQQGQNSRYTLLLSMIILCLGGSLVTLLLLERMVIGRTRLLYNQVSDITSGGDFSRRVHTRSGRLSDDGDELTQLVMAVNGLLTAVEHSHRNLLESENRFRTFMDNSPAVAFIKDEAGRILYINATFERMLQRKGEDVLGRTDEEIWPPEVAKVLKEHDCQVREHLRALEVEERVPRFDNEYSDLLVFKFPLTDTSGRVMVAGMAVDITERKAMERMKNEFISVVSHELRTPVTSIRGAIGLINGGALGEVPHAMSQLLQIANKNSIRLTELLNDILDLQKMEAGSLSMTLEPLEIETLVAIAVDINSPYAKEHNTNFVVESEVGGARVLGDADRLQQVMANLLSNAAKFTPPEHSVRVKVERVRDAGHSWLRVSVTNWGPEIPANFRHRVFSKFAQADASSTRPKGGTGLGLSISKAIVEKLNGRIGFTSNMEEGTTFYFELREIVEA